MHRKVSQVQAHQDVPLQTILQQLEHHRDLSYSPLFQVMFGVQHFGDLISGRGQNSSVEWFYVDTHTTWFDIKLTVDDKLESMQARLDYATSLFHHSTIERFWSDYVILLEHMVNKSDDVIKTKLKSLRNVNKEK